MASLKDGYSEEYKSACLVLALVIVLFSPNLVQLVLSYMPNPGTSFETLTCYAAFLALAYVIGITVDALVPYNIKELLLYPSLRGKGLLRPGCRIFTKIANEEIRDPRLDLTFAKKQYTEILNECVKKNRSEMDLASFQNSSWYSIYQQHASTPSVLSNNLGYLYCRDVCLLSSSLTLIGFLCNLICFFFQTSFLIGWPSIIISLIMAISSWISAHSKGMRLAITVISCDLAAKKGAIQ